MLVLQQPVKGLKAAEPEPLLLESSNNGGRRDPACIPAFVPLLLPRPPQQRPSSPLGSFDSELTGSTLMILQKLQKLQLTARPGAFPQKIQTGLQPEQVARRPAPAGRKQLCSHEEQLGCWLLLSSSSAPPQLLRSVWGPRDKGLRQRQSLAVHRTIRGRDLGAGTQSIDLWRKSMCG